MTTLTIDILLVAITLGATVAMLILVFTGNWAAAVPCIAIAWVGAKALQRTLVDDEAAGD